MLVVLKIPVAYLGVVVWWAIRAVPEEHGGDERVSTPLSLEPCDWRERRRRRPPRRPRLGPAAHPRRSRTRAGARR